MDKERIKELAEAIEKELRSMLRERGYNGIRVQQFIAEHIRTVAAEAREEGIDEMRLKAFEESWSIGVEEKELDAFELRLEAAAERLKGKV